MSERDELELKIQKLVHEILDLKAKTIQDNQELIDTTKQIKDSTYSYVKANPGKALLISLGIGALLGYLLRRK